MSGSNPDITQILTTIGIVIGIGLFLALLLLGWVLWRIKRINLPPDADFFTALRLTPLSVVLLIDMLDLSLDFLSAPISWVILGKLGLQPLRAVTVVESVIPFTQWLPTMTIAWIIARVWKNPPRIPGAFRP